MSKLSDFIKSGNVNIFGTSDINIIRLTKEALTTDRINDFTSSGTWVAPDDGFIFLFGWGAGGGGPLKDTFGEWAKEGTSGGDTTIEISDVGTITLTGGEKGLIYNKNATDKIPPTPGKLITNPPELSNYLNFRDGAPYLNNKPERIYDQNILNFPDYFYDQNQNGISMVRSNNSSLMSINGVGRYGGGGGLNGNRPGTVSSISSANYQGGVFGDRGKGADYTTSGPAFGGAGSAVLYRSMVEVKRGTEITVTIGAAGIGGNAVNDERTRVYGGKGSGSRILFDFWTDSEISNLLSNGV